jgi:tetratricopeptide (TPR) repeat protein
MTSHPTQDELDRFLTARLDPEEQRWVVGHLLAGCAVCRRSVTARKAGRSTPRGWTGWEADERKLERALEVLRGRSKELSTADAMAESPPRGRELVEALLRRSFALRYTESRAMEDLTFQALLAAESLDREDGPQTVICDLQARAWAELANAFKVGEKYAEAEAAFRRGRALLQQGSGDLALLAHVSWLEACLRINQRRLEEARELLAGAYWLYLKLEDRHLAGRTLISKGTTLFYEGKVTESAKIYQKALAMIDADRDPQLVLVGQQCFASSLMASGQFEEADRRLEKMELRRAFAANPMGLLRIRWGDGKLWSGLGRTAEATRELSDVRSQFLDRELPYTAAMVGLDLLPLLQRQGKAREVRQTARKSYATLRELKIFPEAAKVESYLA